MEAKNISMIFNDVYDEVVCNFWSKICKEEMHVVWTEINNCYFNSEEGVNMFLFLRTSMQGEQGQEHEEE